MSARLAGLLVMLLLTAGCRAPGRLDPLFQKGSVTDGSLTLQYAVYLPQGHTPSKEWPVVLFLHGYGERGEDGVAPTVVGLGPAIRRHPERFPCIVVMPQAPRSYHTIRPLWVRGYPESPPPSGAPRRRSSSSGSARGRSVPL